MRIAGKIFGAILALFGSITDILDIIDMTRMTTNIKSVPNIDELVRSQVWVFVIGTLLVWAGVVIFRKS